MVAAADTEVALAGEETADLAAQGTSTDLAEATAAVADPEVALALKRQQSWQRKARQQTWQQ